MAADLKSLGVLMCAMLCAGIVVGEELPDPTRPAVELVPRLDSGEAVAPPLAPAGLQLVILSGKREAAIINGTEVERGKKYGDAVLTVVNETCVVLLGPQGRQVMHQYPTVIYPRPSWHARDATDYRPFTRQQAVRPSKKQPEKQSNRSRRKPQPVAVTRAKTGV